MQQGFGILLLADEIERARRRQAEAAGLPSYWRSELAAARRAPRERDHSISLRVPRFVITIRLRSASPQPSPAE